MLTRLERAAAGRWGAAMGRRWYAVVVFALLAALFGCWCLATPPFSGVDEDGHYFRVASIAGGELVASRDSAMGYGTEESLVFVPGAAANVDQDTACRIGLHGPLRDCSARPAGDDQAVAVPSGAARYNPLYYAVLGVGSQLFSMPGRLYLARLLSIAICAALLAAAFAAARAMRSRLGTAGCLLALTPMSMFLMGTINPNAVEIAAAIAVWALGLTIALGEDLPSPRRWYELAACASVMALTRVISPVWLILIVTVLCVRAGRVRLRELARCRHLWSAVAITVLAGGLNLAWSLYSDLLAVAPPVGRQASRGSFVHAVAQTWLHSGKWWGEAVGVFGYQDVFLPASTLLVYVAALVLFSLAAASGGWRLAGSLALLTAVVSLTIAAANFNTLGLWWQGRYSLPLLVGVPLLLACGPMPARGRRLHRTGRPQHGRIALVVSACLVVVVGVAALRTMLRRVTTPTPWAISHGGAWQPPIPSAWILTAATVLLAGLAWLCIAPALAPSLAPPPSGAGSAAPEPAVASKEPHALLNR